MEQGSLYNQEPVVMKKELDMSNEPTQADKHETPYATAKISANGFISLEVPELDTPTLKGVYAVGRLHNKHLAKILDNMAKPFNFKVTAYEKSPNRITFTFGTPKSARNNPGDPKYAEGNFVGIALFVNKFQEGKLSSMDIDDIDRKKLVALMNTGKGAVVMLQRTTSKKGLEYTKALFTLDKDFTPSGGTVSEEELPL